jgi:glutaredoxin
VSVPRLTLYLRTYCHLCDEMLATLAPMQDSLGFDLRTVDIEDDPELEARFGELVPVLMKGDQEICHYVLDENALARNLGLV